MATISNNEIKIKYSLDTTDLANATALFDRLSAEDRQLLNDLRRLQAQFNATGQAGQQAGTQISNSVSNSRKELGLMGGAIRQVGSYIATYFSVQALANFTKQVIQTTIKFEALSKAIQFTSGSVSAGLANFQFLEKTAKDLGLPLAAAAEGFKSMSAAANRAGITFKEQQKMFLDLSKGMAALSLTSQDASLVFFGFGQLLSKNKVSAQELYHQIGERLPIAMQAAQIAAAKVTGQVKVTGSELIKLVEDGKLMSSEFAPAFTDAIAQIAGESAKIDTLGKNFTRLGNAWEDMLFKMGESTSGFWYTTTKFITKAIEEFTMAIQGWEGDLQDTQTRSFNYAMIRYKDASKEFLDLMIQQKEGEAELFKTQVEIAENLNQLKDNETTTRNLEKSQVELASINGELDALIRLRTDLNKKTKESADNDDKANKAAEKLYKKLINQQEALMKAEEDLIKSRTRAGTDQEILIIENRIKFNNKMLSIDQDARFKELELAKNNAVKRKAELQKDQEEEQEIVRQARFKAFAAETEYINKSNEFIKEQSKKRRQQLQTDEQNELEDVKATYQEEIKILTEKYNEAKKIESQSQDSLELLKINYEDTLTKLTEDGEKEREAIRAKYRAKEKQERIQTELEVRSIMVEAATIRNQALAKSESERAQIGEEGAITQINIKKQENEKQRLLNEENSTITEAERKNLNDKLAAQDVLLDAQLTEIVRQGELRRLQEREEKAKMAMEIAQTISDGLFDIYNQQLSNELTLLNNKYNEEVRLADGNKQKLAQLEQDKREKEKEIKTKQFRADQMAASARVLFATATQLMSSALNPALIPYIIGLSVAQLALINSQPVPEFAEGTKGRKFKGGPAIVGEKGVEKVITESGKVYYTPPTATLLDLPKGAQVIPNHALSRKEMFWANALNDGKAINQDNYLGPKLDRIGGILEALPVHQISMNEKGFEKFVRTPRRTTKILNNQFPVKH